MLQKTFFVLFTIYIQYSGTVHGITDLPGDVYTILFGNLSKVDDFFFLSLDKQTELELEDDNFNTTYDPFEILEPSEFEVHSNFSQDLEDFNGPTRRQAKHVHYYVNHYYGNVDPEDVQDIERQKKRKLIDIHTQFIIHTRYKISLALRQKARIRNDKKYMLGYLFSKVRRFHRTQSNILAAAHADYLDRTSRTLSKLFHFYQMTLRLDVDIKNVIDYIRELDAAIDKEDIELVRISKAKNSRRRG